MPLNRECLNRRYGPARFDVTEEVIDAFAEATLDQPAAYHRSDGIYAPPTLAFLPCWPVILEALADPDLGNEGQIIHGEQVMRWYRPLIAGDSLTTTGTVTAIESKGRNELYVLSLQTYDDRGHLVVEQENICISLGTAPPDGVTAERSQARQTATANVAGNEAEAEVQRFAESEELPADITQRYAAASGDHNKLHLDGEVARGLGFPGIIVHGMCLVSIAMRPVVHQVVVGDIGRIAELRVRFSNAIQPGDKLTTRYEVSSDSCTFESFGSDGRKILGAGVVALAEKGLTRV